MGMISPPRALSKEEYEKAGCRDIELERWFRYSGHLGFIVLLWDKVFKKEI